MSYDKDDPRLTAYVLDELDDAKERAAIDEATKADPALRSLIDEIADASRAINRALVADDGLTLTAEQREQIQVNAATRRPRFITRGRIVFGAVAALAASVLVALVFTEDGLVVRQPNQTQIAAFEAQHSAPITGGPTSARGLSESENVLSRKPISQPKQVNDIADRIDESAPQAGASAPTPVSGEKGIQSFELQKNLEGLGFIENRTKLHTESPKPATRDEAALGEFDAFTVAPNGSSASAQHTDLSVAAQSQKGLPMQQWSEPPKGDYAGPIDSNGVAAGDGLTSGTQQFSEFAGGEYGGNGQGSVGFGGGGLGGGQTANRPNAWHYYDARVLEHEQLETLSGLEAIGEKLGRNDPQLHDLQLESKLSDEQTRMETENRFYYRVHAADSAESYAPIVENPFVQVSQVPLSTFGLDVDTASYANVRRFLHDGQLPPPNAVRVEEFVNAFRYEYSAPTDGRAVAVQGEIAGCPWNAEHRLARIAVKAKEVPFEAQPPLRMTFLIDVSGSMQDNNKLPLLRESMKALTRKLRPSDQIAMVTYNNTAQRVLAPTPCSSADTICATIDSLNADGSTNGAGGIELAYAAAKEQFFEGGLNRVILATDGDFNVGETENAALVQRIQDHAKSGVFLTVLGFGVDNLKDDRLEALADKGNGNYFYIDSYAEANRVLVERMAGTIAVAAKDAKIQVEFNPAKIGAYRLLGYENRALAAQDFNDDKKDAGDLGAGHTVTALYELVPVGASIGAPGVDELKYQAVPAPPTNDNPECMTVKLRYKQPNADESDRIELPLVDTGLQFENAPNDFRFATAAAAFAMLLRNSQFAGGATYDMVRQIAEAAAGGAPERTEFVSLVVAAKTLAGRR